LEIDFSAIAKEQKVEMKMKIQMTKDNLNLVNNHTCLHYKNGTLIDSFKHYLQCLHRKQKGDSTNYTSTLLLYMWTVTVVNIHVKSTRYPLFPISLISKLTRHVSDMTTITPEAPNLSSIQDSNLFTIHFTSQTKNYTRSQKIKR